MPEKSCKISILFGGSSYVDCKDSTFLFLTEFSHRLFYHRLSHNDKRANYQFVRIEKRNAEMLLKVNKPTPSKIKGQIRRLF